MNKDIIIEKLIISIINYKNSLEIVENICNDNIKLSGSIYQINSALRNIENNEKTIVIPEAIICAKNAIIMEYYKKELLYKYKIKEADIIHLYKHIL